MSGRYQVPTGYQVIDGCIIAVKFLRMKNLIKIVGGRSRDLRGGNKYEICLEGFLNNATEQLSYSVAS